MPSTTKIYSHDLLKQWVVQNSATDPLTRSSYNAPEAYRKDNQSYPTRYRYHPYTLEINGKKVEGVSQELNRIIEVLHQQFPELKNKAATSPQIHPVDNDDSFDEAPRNLAFN